MLAAGHLVSAVGVVTVYYHVTGSIPSGAEFGVYLIGALTPDIDGDGMITRPGFTVNYLFGRTVRRAINAIGAGISGIIQLLCRHRGFFHWPLVGLAITGAGYALSAPLLIWFGWGYLVHLLGDFITPQGIPVFAPLSARSIGLGLVSTGSIAEKIATFLGAIAVAYYAYLILP